MAVSKRLRYEVLKRDGYSCRYCGLRAGETELVVDHVVPESLGGSDDPTNLVAACRDCNAGKSSVHPDAPLVAEVSEDAERWARAMEIVAMGRAVERYELNERRNAFLDAWNIWTFNSNGKHVPMPSDWRISIDNFFNAGLDEEDLTELVDVAMRAKSKNTWRYFCGCCWTRIRDMQDHAKRIVARWDAEQKVGV